MHSKLRTILMLISSCSTIPIAAFDSLFTNGSTSTPYGRTATQTSIFYSKEGPQKFTVWEFFMLTGIVEHVELDFYLPYVLKGSIPLDLCNPQESPVSVVSGIGDMELFAHYQFSHREQKCFTLDQAFHLGVLFPTGDPCTVPGLGVGSYNVSCYLMGECTTRSTIFLYNLGTYSPFKRKKGRDAPLLEFAFTLALKPPRFQEVEDEQFVFLIEGNLSHSKTDTEVDPAPLPALGRRVALLGPGFSYQATKHVPHEINLILRGAIQVPVYEKRFSADQLPFDLRLRLLASIEF